MKHKLFVYILLVVFVIILGKPCISGILDYFDPIKKLYPALPMTARHVIDFVLRYRDKECIVVDKENHLLYYMRYGKIVKEDQFNGRTYTFPVPISIGMGGFYETPEGEFTINGKNPNSRFTKFLKLNVPYSIAPYGIHAGPTYLAKKYEKLELSDPYGKYVTKKDDTRGCVGVETLVMKYLFEKVSVNTPVYIY